MVARTYGTPGRGLTVTTARGAVGGAFNNGARSWSPGMSPLQQSQLRSLEQGGYGGSMSSYGSLDPNSMTNQRRMAMGAAPVTSGSGSHGMNARGRQGGLGPSIQETFADYRTKTLAGLRRMSADPVAGQFDPAMSAPPGAPATAYSPRGPAPGGVLPSPVVPGAASPSGGAMQTGYPRTAGTGQVRAQPTGSASLYGPAITGTQQSTQEFLGGSATNPAATPGNGFVYKGIGPEGNAVFDDPATGEFYTFDARAGDGLTPGQTTALPESQAPQTGLIGAEDALSRGLTGGLAAVQGSADQSREDLLAGNAGAVEQLGSIADYGRSANSVAAALSGALGGEAQRAAFDDYENSPGFDYLLDQSERAIRRNAAATGGTQGGNVQRELQENAIGLAAQDFDNNFDRISSVSDRGTAAAGRLGDYSMRLGDALTGVNTNAGNLAANMAYGTGNNVAAGRTRAGERIADNIDSTSSNLASILTSTGNQVANQVSAGGNNLAQLLAGSGRDDLSAQQQYAALLANLLSGQGTQVAGLPALGNTQQTDGVLDDIGALLTGIGQL